MVSLRLLALTLFSLLVISQTSCSSGISGYKRANDVSLTPSERWPETGDFRYNLNGNIDDTPCHAGDFFYRKADYCIALTDREKNSNCALEARRDTYISNCGRDFEETNIKGRDWYGWDKRLDNSCSTLHVSDNFPTLTAYCVFLKDERKHNYCHWDGRRLEFIQNSCPGPFSSEPPPEDK